MIHSHETIERLARQICDEANGAGHFDAPRTHRNHWRKRARAKLDKIGAAPLVVYLMRACGWQV